MRAENIDGRSVRAIDKRKVRREEILGVALKLFASKGYESTSVADVIEVAGVSRGTFYLYFDSRETLFHELVEGFIRKLMGSIERVRPEDGEVLKQVYENVRRVVDLLFDHPELSVILLREAVGFSAEVDKKLNDLNAFLYRMAGRALQNGAGLGLIRKVNEQVVAMAMIGSIKEVLYQYLVARPDDVPDRDTIARELLEYGYRGLANLEGSALSLISVTTRGRG